MIGEIYKAYKVVRAIHGRRNEANATRADMIWNHHSRHPDITYEQAEKFVDEHLIAVKKETVPTPRDIETEWGDEWNAADGGG